jgi:hypothetical protein
LLKYELHSAETNYGLIYDLISFKESLYRKNMFFPRKERSFVIFLLGGISRKLMIYINAHPRWISALP